MYQYELTRDSSGVRILSYDSSESIAEVPESLLGLPVTEIAPYAFSGSDITVLDLPKSVIRMGKYALYQCSKLRELHFYNSLRDFGAGAFTGCHQIRRIVLRLEGDDTSSLRDVLMEIPEEILVEYHYQGKTARLCYPEFYEEGVENTPARIIESHTHGSGMFYRNCFVKQKLQFSEYDGRFPYALGQENLSFLIRLVTERLAAPYALSPNAKSAYESFLDEYFSQALDYYVQLQQNTSSGPLASQQAQEAQRMTHFLMGWNRSRKNMNKLQFEL